MTVAQRGSGQDRAAIFTRGRAHVAVIADGAGGTSGGAEAAELVVDHVRRVVEGDMALRSPTLWRQTLLEASIAAEGIGQTTAVVVGGGWGASVGDSGAWRIRAEGFVELDRRAAEVRTRGTHLCSGRRVRGRSRRCSPAAERIVAGRRRGDSAEAPAAEDFVAP